MKAHSNTEVEYRNMAYTKAEIVLIQTLSSELGISHTL